jgi:hypothetical protein
MARLAINGRFWACDLVTDGSLHVAPAQVDDVWELAVLGAAV